jgi:hypothetical protein
MNRWYVIIFMIFLLSLAIDPTPTVPEDTTDFHFPLSASDNSNNKNGERKIMTQSTFVLNEIQGV